MLPCQSGRGAARLARLHGVQEVGGSNPLAPTQRDSRRRVSSVKKRVEVFSTHSLDSHGGINPSRWCLFVLPFVMNYGKGVIL